MNQITLIGHLTADPTTRATPNGVTVCSFTIGVTRSRKDANGEKQSDFFRINTWRQTADFCGKYLTKGSRVAVVGELNLNSYKGKDGQTRYSLDVQADHVENLTEKKEWKEEPRTVKQEKPVSEWEDISSDDLPWSK
jgi:single-strand DNA-binding protein